MNFPSDNSIQTSTALSSTGLSYTYVNSNDLTVYAIKSNVDSSLNNLTSTKQNTLTFSSPLTNTSNNISIDLSTYLSSSTASSTYATITNLNTKQNSLTFSSPLINTLNNITIDLSAYDTISLRNTALGSYLP